VRILQVLYYYRPHFSGLTVYTERLSKGLVARGHQVTILTSRYDRMLPPSEVADGVEIRRVNVLARISKGPIMPTFLAQAMLRLRRHDIVHLHVPQIDAAGVAVLSRLLGRPVVMTYHCDLSLPAGLMNRLANLTSNCANRITARLANVIATNTREYAQASQLLSRHMEKLSVIYPPIELAPASPEQVDSLRRRWGIRSGEVVIGMVARLATEKGAETLAEAMPLILRRYPQARVLYVGQHQEVMGEEEYARRLAPLLARLGDHWQFLGVLQAADLAAFYALCNVTVLPSLNSTESFGMVQIESMLCGTPVIASDLPGVRQPTALTGMGRTFPPRDAAALAGSILQVLDHSDRYTGDPRAVARQFSTQAVAIEYEKVYRQLLGRQTG
jgi:glycosyltransferase involved in cell wall biosynthesis